MARYFLDSSALLKRYRQELGSRWVLDLAKSSGKLIVARLAHIEVTAALVRRGRQSGSPSQATLAALATLDADVAREFEVVEFGNSIIARSIELAKTRALRAADAMQLACALFSFNTLPAATDFCLVSADDELNAAATAEGLQVENPNLHP